MVKVFTIKEGVPTSIFGFERSQLDRQKIFEDLGIEHKLVLTNLDSLVPNYVETLSELGFKNFHHAIFDLSDLARVSPSVKEESLNKENISYIEYTSNGSVGLVHYKDGVVECYTSHLLYRVSFSEDRFELFDSHGLLLVGDISENYMKLTNVRTSEVHNQWSLVAEYLAYNSTAEDKFIIDMVNEYPLQLRKFFQNTNRTLFAFTHYNILDPRMRFVLQGWCKNIVASPVLEKRLGSSSVRFLPPIYVDEFRSRSYSSVKDWCIIGNMTFLKRCEWAIEVFRQLPDFRLTIYGNLPSGYAKDSLPDNVVFGGSVKTIEYNKHGGYISCSMSECFANSAVEASANGLVCLLSNVDLAHKYYGSLCSNTQLFNSQEELLNELKGYAYSEEGFNSSTFAENYSYSKVISLYKEFFFFR